MYSVMRQSGLLASLLVLAVARAEAAPIVLDTFNAPGSTVQSISGASGGLTPSLVLSNTQILPPGALAFGTSRTIDMQRTSGSGSFSADVNTTSAGTFAFANGILTGSINNISYPFLPSLNFTGAGSIDLQDLTLDIGSVDISVYLSNGVDPEVQVGLTQTINGPTNVPLLSFALGAVSDDILSSVTNLRVRFDSNNLGSPAGSDMLLGAILIPDDTTQNNGVPEPATLGTFAVLGLAGLAARRKMKKAVA